MHADGAPGIADIAQRIHAAEHTGLIDQEEPPGAGPVGLFEQLRGHIHRADQEAGEGGEVLGRERGHVDEDIRVRREGLEMGVRAVLRRPVAGHVREAHEGELVGDALDHAGEGALIKRGQSLHLIIDQREIVFGSNQFGPFNDFGPFPVDKG